jgi:hypothetical protein
MGICDYGLNLSSILVGIIHTLHSGADQIHTVATTFNLPVLSVHDSFIVAREDQETLTHIMRVATKQQLGHELKTDVTALDDLPARSDGYLSRLARHQTDHPLTVPIMRDGRM